MHFARSFQGLYLARPNTCPNLAKYAKEAKEGPLRMTNCRTSEDSYSAHGKCGRLSLAKEQTITKLTRNLFPDLELDALSRKQNKNHQVLKNSGTQLTPTFWAQHDFQFDSKYLSCFSITLLQVVC